MSDRPPLDDDDPFGDLQVSWLREADLIDDWTDPTPAPEPEVLAPVAEVEPEPEPEPEPVVAVEPEPEPVVAVEPESEPQTEPVVPPTPLPDWTTPVRALDEPVAEPAWPEPAWPEPAWPEPAWNERLFSTPTIDAVEEEPLSDEDLQVRFVFDPAAFEAPAAAFDAPPSTAPLPELQERPEPELPTPVFAEPEVTAAARPAQAQKPPRQRRIRTPKLRSDGQPRRSLIKLIGMAVALGLLVSVALIAVIGAITILAEHALN